MKQKKWDQLEDKEDHKLQPYLLLYRLSLLVVGKTRAHCWFVGKDVRKELKNESWTRPMHNATPCSTALLIFPSWIYGRLNRRDDPSVTKIFIFHFNLMWSWTGNYSHNWFIWHSFSRLMDSLLKWLFKKIRNADRNKPKVTSCQPRDPKDITAVNSPHNRGACKKEMWHFCLINNKNINQRIVSALISTLAVVNTER